MTTKEKVALLEKASEEDPANIVKKIEWMTAKRDYYCSGDASKDLDTEHKAYNKRIREHYKATMRHVWASIPGFIVFLIAFYIVLHLVGVLT